MRFNLKFFIVTLIIFAAELLIATVFRHNAFIRGFIGDVLELALIYTFALAFFKIKNRNSLIIGIFIFSVVVETLQYFKIAEKLGFKPNSLGAIIIGNSFSWWDIACYAVGCLILFLLNRFIADSK